MRSFQTKALALARVEKLFSEAHKAFKGDSTLADKYVLLARKIAMKHKLRMPRALKRRYCKHCYRYFMPGKSCRVRLQKHRVVYHCNYCKKYMRLGIAKKG